MFAGGYKGTLWICMTLAIINEPCTLDPIRSWEVDRDARDTVTYNDKSWPSAIDLTSLVLRSCALSSPLTNSNFRKCPSLANSRRRETVYLRYPARVPVDRYRFSRIKIASSIVSEEMGEERWPLESFTSVTLSKWKSFFSPKEGFVIQLSRIYYKVESIQKGEAREYVTLPISPAVPETSIPLINILLNPTPWSITYVRHAV